MVLPEAGHTVSPLIDDIEGESESRREGPCVHEVLGVAPTINAVALYFGGERINATIHKCWTVNVGVFTSCISQWCESGVQLFSQNG
jgi:geranylgeranyl pyrophosphate synthase